MAENSLIHCLTVSPYTDENQRYFLVYSREGSTGVPRLVDREQMQRQMDRLAGRIEAILHLAEKGSSRNGLGVEEDADRLAATILPERGLVDMVGEQAHVQIRQLLPSPQRRGGLDAIHWEAFEEEFFVCGHHNPPHRKLARSDDVVRGAKKWSCAAGHECLVQGGPLALHRQLTYFKTHQPMPAPSKDRNKFLIIFNPQHAPDPCYDLCHESRDPLGVCAKHYTDICEMLTSAGFYPVTLSREQATLQSVESQIERPDVVGMYYFGHGVKPEIGEGGGFLLAHGERLTGSAVADLDQRLGFVFLNACFSAGFSERMDWAYRSIATAFAMGESMQAVIGTLFPVINTQAAKAATTFFTHALNGATAVEALSKARAESYSLYEAGDPHLSWCAYRYFGQASFRLQSILPARQPQVAHSSGDSSGDPSADAPALDLANRRTSPPLPIFDDDDRLVVSRFSFDMDAVLLRAGKRRNIQFRRLVSLTDLFAGLIRVGGLSRAAVNAQQPGQPPFTDRVYKALEDRVDLDPAAAASAGYGRRPELELRDLINAYNESDDATRERLLSKLFDRFVVKERSKFDERAIQALEQAAQLAAEGPDERVTERDLLNVLLSEPMCRHLHLDHLPPNTRPDPSKLTNWLREHRSNVDGDGRPRLDYLDRGARRVLEAAHLIAQQMGHQVICHSHLLTAFVITPHCALASHARCVGHYTMGMAHAWMQMAGNRGEPVYGRLGLEAVELIRPVLEDARSRATDERVSELDLFASLCGHLAPELVHSMAVSPLPVNLKHFCGSATRFMAPERFGRINLAFSAGKRIGDNGGSVRLDDFDDRAREALRIAAHAVVSHGHGAVRSPHLFIGMLGQGPAPVARELESRGADLEFVRTSLLSTIPDKGVFAGHGDLTVGISENTLKLLVKAGRKVRPSDETRLISVEDICKAMFEQPSDIVPQSLAKMNVPVPSPGSCYASLAKRAPDSDARSTGGSDV